MLRARNPRTARSRRTRKRFPWPGSRGPGSTLDSNAAARAGRSPAPETSPDSDTGNTEQRVCSQAERVRERGPTLTVARRHLRDSEGPGPEGGRATGLASAKEGRARGRHWHAALWRACSGGEWELPLAAATGSTAAQGRPRLRLWGAAVIGVMASGGWLRPP
jgi:hypothetical protein